MPGTDDWTSRWWGGPLSDGTVIVTSPTYPAEIKAIHDLTTGKPTPRYDPTPQTGLKGWLNSRSDHVGRLPLPINPLRRSLLLAAAAFLGWVVLVAVTNPPENLMILFSMAALLTAVLAFGLSEGTTVREGLLIHVPLNTDRQDAPLRYVHDVVAATREWQTLTWAADQIGPGTVNTNLVHHLLWEASETKVYEDTGTIPDDELAALRDLTRRAVEAANQT